MFRRSAVAVPMQACGYTCENIVQYGTESCSPKHSYSALTCGDDCAESWVLVERSWGALQEHCVGDVRHVDTPRRRHWHWGNVATGMETLPRKSHATRRARQVWCGWRVAGNETVVCSSLCVVYKFVHGIYTTQFVHSIKKDVIVNVSANVCLCCGFI